MDTSSTTKEDLPLYDLIMAIHELWGSWTGARNPGRLVEMALEAEAGLEEQMDRNPDFLGVVSACTPTIEEVVSAFQRHAVNLKGVDGNHVEEIVSDYRATIRHKERVIGPIDPTQMILHRRQEIATATFSLVQIMLKGDNSMAATAAQAFAREVTTWRDEQRLNKQATQDLEYLFGRAYILKLFAIFAANEALPRAQRVPLDVMVVCATYKYGRPAEIITTDAGPVEMYRCFYCNYGPCACGNRPPAEGVAKMKRRQEKYPTNPQQLQQAAREVSADQLDLFMLIIYVLRNIVQGLKRGPDRARYEFQSEYAFGWRLAEAGDVTGIARAYGQLFSSKDRRCAAAIRHAWAGDMDRIPATDLEVLQAIADKKSPIRRNLPDADIGQIFRHAASDPITWGVLPPATYGLRFRQCVQTAIHCFTALQSGNI